MFEKGKNPPRGGASPPKPQPTFEMPPLPALQEGQVMLLGLCQRPAPNNDQQAMFSFALTLCLTCQRRMIDAEPRDDLASALELLCPKCNHGPKERSVLYLLPQGDIMKALLTTKLKFEKVGIYDDILNLGGLGIY